MNEEEEEVVTNKISIVEREKEERMRERLYNKKYLSEIIKEEKPVFEKNNLILAPVGSGKSHLIEKILIPKGYNKKVLYLTSNTALKDSLCPNDNKSRKELAEEGKSLGFFTSKNKTKFGNVNYSVHVMTYAEFGNKIHPPNETFTANFDLIFCDEIHSLPQYIEYDSNYKLGAALRWLLSEHKNKKIYYFTATSESIDNIEKRTPGYFNKVKTFNYLNHPEIREYVSKSTYYIKHIEQVRMHLEARKKSFDYYGFKALAFTKAIKEQEKIKKLAEEEGYKPIVLWSINNKDYQMDEEQLRVRERLLKTGLIPEPYNILIINGSMQEGWNLHDKKVSLAILDTVDITEQVQSLGRIRQDIDLVIKKTKNESLLERKIKIPDTYINTHLTTDDKKALCEELSIINDRGVIRKWPSIKAYAKESGYTIEDKVIVMSGKQVRTSVITEPQETED